MTKTFIWIGVFVGSLAGGFFGALFAHNNWLSWQSILASTIGAFVGIWAGYKAGQYL